MKKKPSYACCGICGRIPQTAHDQPNYGPVKWWDPDDGWKIGTLCSWCIDEFGARTPKKEDYAFNAKEQKITVENTDQDPHDAIVEVIHIQIGSQHFTRNKKGRCEDAPCCGCCTI